MLRLTPLLLCCASMLLQASAASKLAFLTPPRHHHRSQTSFSTPHIANTDKIYSINKSYNSRIKATSDNTDDDSICDVYQQVKEEDSEWYSKISEMLGNDEMELLDTTFTCGDGSKEVDTGIKSRETSKQVTSDDLAGNDQSSKEDANNDVETKGDTSKETSILEAPVDSTVEDDVDESPKKQEETSTASPVAARHSDGHYTQFLDEDDVEDDIEDGSEEDINKETKSKIESKEDAPNATNNDGTQAQHNQVNDVEVEKDLSPPSYIVRIYNEFTKEHENIAPLSALEKLGYTEKELQLLRPQVLELIVDDRIPRPRRGIPKRWVKSKNDDEYDEEDERYDDDFGWQVQVVPRKKKQTQREPGSPSNEQRANVPIADANDADENSEKDDEPITRRSSEPSSRVKDEYSQSTSDEPVDRDDVKQPRKRQQQQQKEQQQQEQQYSSEYEQEFRRKRGYRPPPQRRRQPQSSKDDGYDERTNSRRPRRQRSSDRRQRTPKRQELLIDRDSYGDDPSGNKFWMDLPMFKDFLRKEAQFRLKILGPDWKESVLDESRWRYDLYKTWLQMIDEGVGENPLYTYTDNPRPRTRRSRSRSDANYERENTRDASRRRVPRSQEDVSQRRTVEDRDDAYERLERKRNLDDVDNEQRRRSRRPEQPRSEQRQRRQTRLSQPSRTEWTNFNDLEESLLKSKGESQGSRDEYSRRSSDSYDDEIPRRRRRTPDVYEDEPEEYQTPRRRYSTDDYVDSLEEDRQPQRQRRRTRARRDIYDDDDDDEV